MNVISGIIGGFLMGILAAFVVSIAVVPILIGQGSGAGAAGVAPITILVGIVVGIVIGIKASTARKVWRRVLIILAILCFLLPIAGIVFTGGVVSAVSSNSTNGVAAGAGTVIGGTLINRVSRLPSRSNSPGAAPPASAGRTYDASRRPAGQAWGGLLLALSDTLPKLPQNRSPRSCRKTARSWGAKTRFVS